MKEIKTNRYIKKEAQSLLPGDPNLPPGVTEQMISEQGESPEEDVKPVQESQVDIKVDWMDFNNWFVSSGDPLPEFLAQKRVPSYITVYYTYNVENDEIVNIKANRLVDYDTKEVVTDPHILSSLVDYYEDLFKREATTL